MSDQKKMTGLAPNQKALCFRATWDACDFLRLHVPPNPTGDQFLISLSDRVWERLRGAGLTAERGARRIAMQVVAEILEEWGF